MKQKRRPFSGLACWELARCHFCSLKEKKMGKKITEKQQLFLDLSENWGHWANCFLKKWEQEAETEAQLRGNRSAGAEATAAASICGNFKPW